MKRSWMRRSQKPMSRGTPMERGKPLVWHGRRRETRITKGGRIILGEAEYTALCWQVWRRDGGECQIRHQPGCWGRLPGFSKRWMDHIKKRSQGGSDTLENLRCACFPCHQWADNEGGKNSEKKSIALTS